MPAAAHQPDEPLPFAESAEGAVEEEAFDPFDTAYFAAEARRMEAEACRESADI